MNLASPHVTDVGMRAAFGPVRSNCQLAAKKLARYRPASQSGATDDPIALHFEIS